MKKRDRIINYVEIMEYTLELSSQRNQYQNQMNTIPVGSNSRLTYLQNIRELDGIIEENLSRLQEIKGIKLF